jgi:F0F1-type ATP synthase membrane subunit c/vacuolar-type H+-ATPase subunit K
LSFPKAVALISAGIAAGAGTLGPGIGCGIVGTYACRAVSYNPKTDAVLLRTMLVAQAVSQTTAVYALIIAMVLIYAV